ncbi:type VII toxin-antitoxin system HepT family RNase toxin [Alcanivorax profundi]|uniref:type VII toxin-antitoxin system HepT family RNase toxin n=1 Tax=Alcanivorax profundi TaxID=2338368 RepID=UPI0032B108AE
MVDDVLVNKAATIERCVQRAKEEYEKDTATFATDLTRQDAAILNIQRACEAALDMGTHIIRREQLGVPQSSRDVFTLLVQAGKLDENQGTTLKNMVGFRNIAVHEYQKVQLPIVTSIITRHLDDLLRYSARMLQTTRTG